MIRLRQTIAISFAALAVGLWLCFLIPPALIAIAGLWRLR